MIKLNLNEKVCVNTGGKTSPGLVVDSKFSHQNKDGELVFKKQIHGHYWKEQSCYLVRFENGTQQYIPAICISRA